jgi:Domain of unknown function (DUF4440)
MKTSVRNRFAPYPVWLSFVSACLLVTSSANAVTPPPPANQLASQLAKTTITQTEDEDLRQLRQIKLIDWPAAYRDNNIALLDTILHPSFQMIDGSGTVETKQDELKWLKSNKLPPRQFEYRIERIDVYGGATAVIAGLGILTREREGKMQTTRYRSTNILIKENNQWRAIASHVSSVPAEKER